MKAWIEDNCLVTVCGKRHRIDTTCTLLATGIDELPDNFTVNGNFILDKGTKVIPKGLKVDGWMSIENTEISSIPTDLAVEEALHIIGSNVTRIPPNLKVGWIDFDMNPILNSMPTHDELDLFYDCHYYTDTDQDNGEVSYDESLWNCVLALKIIEGKMYKQSMLDFKAEYGIKCNPDPKDDIGKIIDTLEKASLIYPSIDQILIAVRDYQLNENLEIPVISRQTSKRF